MAIVAVCFCVLGAVILIANAAQWIIAEAITASAWTNPRYDYATNYISDLGVPDCGTQFQGRTLCSPLNTLMNTSFAAEGILFAVGILLLARALRPGVRRVVTVLAIAHGAGMLLVGFFHGTADGPDVGLLLHVGGAGIGILSANVLAIIAGSLRSIRLPRTYRVFSIAIGILGIAGIALVGVSASTAGIFERSSDYSWLLWSVLTGILVLVRKPRKAPTASSIEA